MSLEKENSEKLYYSIGELSEIMGVNASLIRFWEKEFTVLKPKKNTKGNRQFSKENLELLQYIHQLVKTQGYTLQGAKEKLKQKENSLGDQAAMIASLERVKSFLLQLKTAL